MERKNLNKKEVEKVIKGMNFVPSRYTIITTINVEEKGEGIVTKDGGVSQFQYVIASGEGSFYKPGDKVMLDLEAMTIKVPSRTDVTKIEEKIKFMPFPWDGMLFSITQDNKVLGKFV